MQDPGVSDAVKPSENGGSSQESCRGQFFSRRKYRELESRLKYLIYVSFDNGDFNCFNSIPYYLLFLISPTSLQ